jgi:two-component sensor histidine kinase
MNIFFHKKNVTKRIIKLMYSYLITIWGNISNTGVNDQQSYVFSDKLRTRNRLSILCVLFSLPYVFFFLKSGLIAPFAIITLGILLFSTSIVLNKFSKYNLSSLLILFTTNWSVLFFSIYLGMNSGIHLYLFTSPLIVLTLFENKTNLFISIAMLSYLMNFFIIILFDKYSEISFVNLEKGTSEFLYLVNFVFSFTINIILSLYFLTNNIRVNYLLVLKNDELILNQNKLIEENEIRKFTEEKALISLKEREILLSEIHHRVKNNLAVVNGLLELQTTYLNDDKTILAFKNSQNRIKSIALLHEKLYENKTLIVVNMIDYINELAHFIKQSSAPKNKKINIILEIDSIDMEMEKAMPFALLLNELISNSYKYAFNNKEEGTIEVCFKKQLNSFVFDFKDNGLGFDYHNEISKGSLGLNLIGSFSEQLNGKFEYLKVNTGIHFVLNF